MSKISNLELYKNIALKHNGLCLSDNYINSKSQLKFKCKNNHEWDAFPFNIFRGHWCKLCNLESIKSKPSNKFTESEINIIINNYNNGQTINSIKNEFKVDHSTIKRIIINNNLSYNIDNSIIENYSKFRNLKIIRNKLKIGFNSIIKCLIKHNFIKVNGKYFKQSEIDYLSENFSKDTCKKLSISIGTGYNILKKYNYNFNPKRKFININSNYFLNIDSEEKAYFLGLILTDGCVHKKLFTILLKNTDDYILKKLSICLTGADYTRPYKTYTILSLTDEVLIKNLKQFNCVERKTYCAKFPQIPSNLNWHLIRGLIDGDGSISLDKKNFRIVLTGYKDLIEPVKQQIESLGVNCYTYKTLSSSKNINKIIVSGNLQVRKVLDKIYQNSNIHLYRKFDVYQKLVNRKK